MPTTPRQTAYKAAAMVALAVLILAGVGHRSLLARIDAALDSHLQPPEALSTLPLRIGPWEGRDVPIDAEVRRIAREDDTLNRLYENRAIGRTLSLYIGYIGRPRSWLGHRPDLCYPAYGFEPVSEEVVTIADAGGAPVPAVLYEFRHSSPGGPRDRVLATYLVNGAFSTDRDAIRGYNERSVLQARARPAYLARVQITLRASGDRAADTRLLTGFAAEVFGQVAAMMPRGPETDGEGSGPRDATGEPAGRDAIAQNGVDG